MIIYAYLKCSTCQKAIRFLEEKKIPFTLKEITKEPPSLKELQEMLSYQEGNIKKLLNTSGLLYREMNLSEKVSHMSSLEVFDLLTKNGMLVKRPFLLGDGFGLLGFKEEEWKKRLLDAE